MLRYALPLAISLLVLGPTDEELLNMGKPKPPTLEQNVKALDDCGEETLRAIATKLLRRVDALEKELGVTRAQLKKMGGRADRYAGRLEKARGASAPAAQTSRDDAIAAAQKLLASFRRKYPQYSRYSDLDIARALSEKYPEYANDPAPLLQRLGATLPQSHMPAPEPSEDFVLTPQELLRRVRQRYPADKDADDASLAQRVAETYPVYRELLSPLLKQTEADSPEDHAPAPEPSVDVVAKYSGAKIVADDDEHTFLGQIENEFSTESVFNDYGTYGSKYSSESIWNEYGQFGGEYSSHSPFNKYSSTPPLIIKNGRVIGRLTVNKYVTGAVDPYLLKAHFTD